MKKVICALLAMLIGFSLFGCAQNAAPVSTSEASGNASIKIGMALPGPINDMGFNSLAYNGLEAAAEEYGCEVTYQESVAQSDMESTLRNFAAAGCDLVIAHGYQFNEAAQAVAAQFPDVKFLVTSSSVSNGKNLASVTVNNTQVGFLLGIVAGTATDSNKVGYIGGVEIPSVVNTGKGMGIGVKYVNPDAEYIETYTGSFDDVNAMKETALAIIDSGADVVAACANQSGLGSIEACAERGVYALGVNSDQKNVAPDSVIVSAILDFSSCIPMLVGKVIDGSFEAKFYDVGISEGLVYLSDFAEFKDTLGEEKMKVITDAIEDLKAGRVDLS